MFCVRWVYRLAPTALLLVVLQRFEDSWLKLHGRSGFRSGAGHGTVFSCQDDSCAGLNGWMERQGAWENFNTARSDRKR